MNPQLVFYLGLGPTTPVVVALLLWAARRHMWRTIALLSLLALGLALASIVLLFIEYRSLGLDPGFLYGGLGGQLVGPLPESTQTDAAVVLLANYERWRQLIFSGAIALATPAWILGIYQTIQARHWRWLAAIVVCAVLMELAAGYGENPWFFGSDIQFAGLLPTHPFAKVLAVAVLPHLAALVTALYSLVVLRPRTAMMSVAPGVASVALAAAAPLPPTASLAAALNTRPADALEDDVVFEVEELPR